MEYFTPNQWAILACVLVLGWLLGLLSRSGGGRWCQEAAEERKRREVAEARIAGANARIAELERHGSSHPITAGTASAIAGAASSGRDDLAQIRGVGAAGETRLNELGYFHYRDIAALSESEAAELEGKLGAEPGLVDREQWREQAALLDKGKVEEHHRRWA